MSLIGLCFDGDIPLLIMPFMTNDTVLEYVKQNRESLCFTQITTKVVIMSLSNDIVNAHTIGGSS